MKKFARSFTMFLIAIHWNFFSQILLNTFVSFALLSLTSLFICAGCHQKVMNGECAISKIRHILAKQQDDWNKGSVEQYMEGYWKSDSVRFASGGNVSHGWKVMLRRYKKTYPSKEAMGQLSFSDMRIDILSDSVALVFGRWQLLRNSDSPNGLFTLVFRLIEKKWRIVSDHTSAAQ